MKVLLDENFPLALHRSLVADGESAEHIIPLGWRGASAERIRERLLDRELLFLTQDEDFLFGKDLAAIVVLSRVKQSRPLKERVDVWRTGSTPGGIVDIDVDAAGHLYVLDCSRQLQKFSPSGLLLARTTEGLRDCSGLGQPTGIAVVPDGNVYVSINQPITLAYADVRPDAPGGPGGFHPGFDEIFGLGAGADVNGAVFGAQFSASGFGHVRHGAAPGCVRPRPPAGSVAMSLFARAGTFSDCSRAREMLERDLIEERARLPPRSAVPTAVPHLGF